MNLQIKPLAESISASVSIPGSKSYTNRSLILAALTKGPVRIDNPLFSEDTEAMINCLKTLGVDINVDKNYLLVKGDISQIKEKKYELNANLSGTTIRFILALSCIIPGVKKLYGEQGLNKRPIKELVDGLRQLGAKIEYLEQEGFPPLLVNSSKLKGGITRLNGGISSQYFSAILMIAPIVGDVTIKVSGKQISKPYIDMTIDTMEKSGVRVINDNYKQYIVKSGQIYSAKNYLVEGDYSSAGYFFALACLTKSKITVENLNPQSKQADKRLLDILKQMGNRITFGENQITVDGVGVKPVKVDMADCPDQVQTVAVLAAFANGATKIDGIKSLRVKETERVMALETELAKMGVKTESTNDSMIIYGGNPKSAIISTYNDHRMAMSFAMAAAKLDGIQIENPEVVNKTFPQFWKKLESIGIKINSVKNIVLIGMRGSGKTTIAKLLSKKLNKAYLELDNVLVKKMGLSIPKIVEKYGWDYFREKESEIVNEIPLEESVIISTGGGAILNPENIKALKTNGVLIYLDTGIKTLSKRVGTDSNRPSLTNKDNLEDELKEVLRKREDIYKKAADLIIKTDSLTAEQTAEKIISLLERNIQKICLVIGDPVNHSLSPLMHNAGYKALRIGDKFIYKKTRVKIEDLKKFINSIRSLQIRGVSLTMPHKLKVMQYLDYIDAIAAKIGAVNTIVNDDGVYKGYNTDWLGIITPLEKITNLYGKKVAILGAGGAAKAAVFGFTKMGARVTIFNRSLDKAKSLADEFLCDFAGFENLAEIKNMDIIFNATALGMKPDVNKSPLPKHFIEKHHIIFDAIYSPYQTRLLKDAKEKGATIIHGIEMLLYQGTAQFELYTGCKAPEDAMRKAVEKNYE